MKRYTKYVPQPFMISFNRHKIALVAMKVSQFVYRSQCGLTAGSWCEGAQAQATGAGWGWGGWGLQ